MLNGESDKMEANADRNYLNIINRYLFSFFSYSCFILFFYHFFFGDMLISIFLTSITFFWLLLMAIKGKTRRFKKDFEAFYYPFVFVFTDFYSKFFLYLYL